MMVLITYDVNTESKAGQKRLRKVAKVCVDYGQRVQNSVFECSLDPGQFALVKSKLDDIIDNEIDSIRFYNLGKHWDHRVQTLGRDDTYHPEKDVLLL